MSFLAGISTVIGALLIFFDKNKNNKIITMSLSFAAGVMICVSLTDLLPNSFKMILNTNNIFPRVILMLIFMIGIMNYLLVYRFSLKKVYENEYIDQKQRNKMALLLATLNIPYFVYLSIGF